MITDEKYEKVVNDFYRLIEVRRALNINPHDIFRPQLLENMPTELLELIERKVKRKVKNEVLNNAIEIVTWHSKVCPRNIHYEICERDIINKLNRLKRGDK